MFVIKINGLYVHKNNFQHYHLSLTDDFTKAKTWTNLYHAEVRAGKYIESCEEHSRRNQKYVSSGKIKQEIKPDDIKIHEIIFNKNSFKEEMLSWSN